MGDFTICCWGQPPASFRKWRDRGVTRFLTNEPVPEGTNRADYCKAAADVGALAMISPSASPNADKVLTGFGGWCQRDEADAGKVSPAGYEAQYFKLRNRGFPVFGNFTHMLIDCHTQGYPTRPTPRDYRQYIRGTDIAGFDWHILNRGDELEEGFGVWERITDGFRMVSTRAKPIWISIETGPHLATSKPITAADFRKLVYKAWYLGAAGIVYFSIREPSMPGGFAWDVTPEDVAAEMPKLAAELTETYETVKQRQNMEAPVISDAAAYQAKKLGEWRPL